MTSPREWHLATRHLGRRVQLFDQLTSTNDYAAKLSGHVANDGLVVLAAEQTAGKGQYGRTWQATPAASVLMSVLLFPPTALQRPVLLTAWAAVSVCELIQKLTGVEATIKWPNDVLLDCRKVCGILIEQRARGGSLATVAGIGLNVNQTAEWFQQAALPEATSLAIVSGVHHECETIARELIVELDDQYHRLLKGDQATLETRWKARLGLKGKDVVVEGTHETYRGWLVDVTFGGVQLQNVDHSLHLPPETVRHINTTPS